MKIKALFIQGFLLTCFLSVPIRAQVRPAIRQVMESQLPAVVPYFRQSDASSQFKTLRQGNVVRDLEAGVVRAKYRIAGLTDAGPSTPEAASRTYLTTHHTEFGLTESLNDLELLEVIDGSYGKHVTYQHYFAGLPVYGRYVKVNLNAANAPSMVINGYAPHLTTVDGFDAQPRISSDAAAARTRVLLDQENLNMTPPALVVYPGEEPVLAWKIVAWPESPALELEILVNARDGEIVKVQHTSTHLDHVASLASAETNASHNVSPGDMNLVALERSALAIGAGYVFDPDPLSTAGQFYAPPFVDNNDGDGDELDAQRMLVDLPDISLYNDGLYRLVGPFVQIVSETSGGTINYAPPAEATPDGFQYTRSNDDFEAVNVYYHIDKSQRYLQSLDVGYDIQNASIRVNPHGLALADNSQYFSVQNYIAFGDGGVDDAEDAVVIWHEYGHALLQGSAPGLLYGTEGQALHEGWADYWAASYIRSLVEGGVIPRDDWQTLFKWDSGDGSIWPGREMSFAGKYPDDTFCDSGSIQCNIYDDGLLWATTLMKVYDGLGRYMTDRLALASHAYLTHPVTFRDAAEAMIQADADLNAGANLEFLIQTFNEKGLLDISSFGPFALHDALPSVEQLGGTVPISVNATGVSAPIQRVTVFYSIDGGSTTNFDLTASSEGMFTGDFPLPAFASQITYYIEVFDELGLSTRLPAADFQTYAFTAGPDTEPPSIMHAQQGPVTLIEWPAQLVANVDDNIGVDTVSVFFVVHDPLGNEILTDTFGLTPAGDAYSGTFPIPINLLEPGSAVSYQLVARDVSLAGNETRLPASGYFVFNIVIEGGIFRRYDFEEEAQGIAGSGFWQRGEPDFGLQVAHSADHVWATFPSAAYPDSPQTASLELSPLNLTALSEAYLVFWHWFDTEHNGAATPDSGPGTTLWDGGNVKVSVDGGLTWSILEPEGGYNGTIASGRENPLKNEPAFGGYSFGWRQVTAPLPTGSEVRIRFDFGTDTGNSESSLFYAGWYIDDITVMTEHPSDSNPPVALILPQLVSVRDAGQLPPELYIGVSDNTGVASVFIDYTSTGGIPDGSFRLPMSLAETGAFTGSFPFASAASFKVGDILTYRVRVRDFAGNTAIFPSLDESPFMVEYRLRSRINLLDEVTASGMWRPAEDGWKITRRDAHENESSLVIGPIDLPVNVDNLQFSLFFDHNLVALHGGNLKLSADGAKSWNVIDPTGGYGGLLSDADAVPANVRGQSAFTGVTGSVREAGFDLLEYRGSQVWLRIDFGAGSKLTDDEFWKIHEAVLAYSTLETVNGTFDIPRKFTLHENYPDPFSTTTTVSYTLSEASPVRLEVYDVLGRRIAIILDEQQSAGTYTLPLDGSSLPNGLYLLRLESDHGSQVEKFVIAR